jgi:hypothetical protein
MKRTDTELAYTMMVGGLVDPVNLPAVQRSARRRRQQQQRRNETRRGRTQEVAVAIDDDNVVIVLLELERCEHHRDLGRQRARRNRVQAVEAVAVAARKSIVQDTRSAGGRATAAAGGR